MTCLIFVEGDDDSTFLHMVLEDLEEQFSFQIIVGGDADAARPMASTALQTSSDPVMLVIDADTTNRAAAKEREGDWNYYLQSSAGGKPFKLVQFVPESEVVFFEVPGLLEQWLKRPVDPVLMYVAEDAPKKVLSVLGTSIQKIVAVPRDDTFIDRLRLHPLLSEMRDFVRAYAPQVQPQLI